MSIVPVTLYMRAQSLCSLDFTLTVASVLFNYMNPFFLKSVIACTCLYTRSDPNPILPGVYWIPWTRKTRLAKHDQRRTYMHSLLLHVRLPRFASFAS